MKKWLTVSTVSLLSTGALGLAAWSTAFAGTSQTPSVAAAVSAAVTQDVQNGPDVGGNVQMGGTGGGIDHEKAGASKAEAEADAPGGANVGGNVQSGLQSQIGGADVGGSADSVNG